MLSKNLLLLVTLLLTVSVSHAQNWRRISREIKEQQLQMFFESKAKEDNNSDCNDDDDFDNLFTDQIRAYHSYRTRFDIPKLLNINPANDTLYILEEDVDITLPANAASTIFTRHGLLSYHLKEKKGFLRKDLLEVEDQPYYTKHILKLVTRWDVETLRKEGKESTRLPETIIRLTMVIFKDKEYAIKHATFEDYIKDEDEFLELTNYNYGLADVQEILKEIFKP